MTAVQKLLGLFGPYRAGDLANREGDYFKFVAEHKDDYRKFALALARAQKMEAEMPPKGEEDEIPA